MTIQPEAQDPFLQKLKGIIEDNLSNEQFGVSELADAIGMSRSNLLRKVNKLAGLSVSQFIRNIRLHHAAEMLQSSEATVSEIAYQVGFNSTSYFIKCYREYYGYPPGETGEQAQEPTKAEPATSKKSLKKKYVFGLATAFVIIAALVLIGIIQKPQASKKRDKSIAVLPFKNDSNDSTNVYLINGLMESVLNDLQKIEDLRVISRTSVEKYRHTDKTIPEIARELNVKYFVEGSGQKIGNKILLNIQLIDAKTDKHLWSKQYNKETSDIFQLQMDVAQNITSEIQAVITPAEANRLKKMPTDNVEAYDAYLKGREYLHQETYEGLQQALGYFEKAVALDPNFALAYAYIAVTYYYTDIMVSDKTHLKALNFYADKALLLDDELPQSLLAKAMYYMNNHEYERAEPFLLKAHQLYPNSATIINFLSDFYTSYIPNTSKYLEFALKGVRLNVAPNDSATTSFIYLHLSNALIQNGFVDLALQYIDKSLDYNPQNLYSQYVKAYMVLAKNRDFEQARQELTQIWAKDTTRLDILQEVGKVNYFLRDYKTAYMYYNKLMHQIESQHLNIFTFEYSKIAFVYEKMGYTEKAQRYYEVYHQYALHDHSIYKNLSMAVYEVSAGNLDEAIKQLKLFAQQKNYHYWIPLFLDVDPFMDPLKKHPEYSKVLKQIRSNFDLEHQKIAKELKAKGLI